MYHIVASSVEATVSKVEVFFEENLSPFLTGVNIGIVSMIYG